MEPKIDELRERGRRQVRRAVMVLGAGAAVGVLLLGGLVIYRLTRPATTRERLRRVVPPGLELGRARRSARRLRKRVPSLRLYAGDRQVGRERPQPRWERLVVAAAGAAGTAAARALAPRLLSALAGGRRGQPKE
jgi:hypothetical protein